MTNQYFTLAAAQEPNTLARAASINQNLQAVQAGFDKLPAPDLLQKDTVTLGIATMGAANEYLLTLPIVPTAYEAGMGAMFEVPAGGGNTGPATLDVMGPNEVYLGKVAIKRADGSSLVEGDMPAGSMATMRHTGTYWQIFSAHGDLAATRLAAQGANTSETNAADSATAAGASATTATNAATAAQGFRDEAQAAKMQSETAAGNAANSSTAAGTSATTASDAATAALGYRDEAAGFAAIAQAASNHEGNAAIYAAAASDSADAAAASEVAAAGSATALANSLIARPIVTADYAASRGDEITVKAPAVTITAPTTPAAEDFFSVFDGTLNAQNQPFFIDFGAAGFDGQGQTLEFDRSGMTMGFKFDGAAWRLVKLG